MSTVWISPELKQVITAQVAAERAVSEAEFLAEAIQTYVEILDADDERILKAAAEGIADIEAGRFQVFSGPEDMLRLRTELSEMSDGLEAQQKSAKP